MAAATHAIGTVVLTSGCLLGDKKQFDSLYSLVKVFSTGYFLFDSNYILQNEKLTTTRLAWLYHHIVTIYYIHQEPLIYNGHKILFWGELSNIPSYFVYHYLQKQMTNTWRFKIWFVLQKILYSGIRLPVLAYLTKQTYQNITHKGPLMVLMPVYLMGIIWTYKLVTQRY